MAMHITEHLMTSDQTPHTATAQHVPRGPALWTVSWLPGRLLDRNQAVSAMQIAVTVGGPLEPGDLRFLHVEGWAAELGLTGPDAVAMARKPPPQDAA